MKYRRQRGQLVDAMLDGHFHIGGRKLAIGAEPDLLFDVGSFLHEMGAQIDGRGDDDAIAGAGESSRPRRS